MKFLKYLLIILIIILIVIGAKKVIEQKKLSNESIKAAKIYSLKVKAKELKEENVQLKLPFLALIQSDSDVKLASKISARIEKIAKVGEKVRVGDILIKLDNSDILAKKDSTVLQIKTTKDILNNLLLTHKRTKELLDIKGASIEEYQSEENKIGEIQSKIDVLNNSLKEIQNLLSYSVSELPNR